MSLNGSSSTKFGKRFGVRSVFKEHSVIGPVNMKLDRQTPAQRRRNIRNGATRNITSINATDEEQWSVQPNELLFRAIKTKGTNSTPQTHMMVTATTDGVDPAEFNKQYAFAGAAIVGANYEAGRDVPIAAKIDGKSQQLNTGRTPIMAGDWVEYYVMDRAEAQQFHKDYGTTRTMPGVRKAEFNLKPESWINAAGYELPGANYVNSGTVTVSELLANAVRGLRFAQRRVIGKALTSADVGGNFEVLLVPLA